nr:MAG TPA: hypothetical protein [Caudoviricetes sp.]
MIKIKTNKSYRQVSKHNKQADWDSLKLSFFVV